MRIKHFHETTTQRLDMETGKVRAFPVVTPSGTGGITVDGTEYWADDEGWIDVPPEIGSAYLPQPGWREDIGEPFPGEVVSESKPPAHARAAAKKAATK